MFAGGLEDVATQLDRTNIAPRCLDQDHILERPPMLERSNLFGPGLTWEVYDELAIPGRP